MATEDFYLNLSPLPSPRWSPLRLTPSPPRPFLPSSNSNYSMVMLYQGSNQSMDDPPQNQEHDDIVDPAPYLARDSASDWRPRGGGNMTMNNQGFEKSNMGFEESMEMTTCFYFPPSPTNFPLYRQMPGVFFVSSNIQNINLALSCQHILEDKSGLDSPINDNSFLNAGVWAPPPMQFQQMRTFTKVYKSGAVGRSIDIARYSGYEELKQDLARRLGIEGQLEDRHRIGYKLVYVDHENDVLLVGEDPWEEFLNCVRCIKILSAQEVQAMSLDIDSFTTVVDAVSEKPSEYFGLVSCNAAGNDEIEAVGTGSEGIGNCVMRDQARLNSRCLRKRKTKGKNLGGERRNKKTNGVRIEILSNNILQTEGMSLKDATNHLEAEAVGKWSGGTWQSDMEEGQLNSRYLGKEKKKEMTRGGEGRNKKNAISLEDILRCKEMPQKVAAKHLKVSRSTLKYNLISQSRPNATPAIVDQEGISQLNFDTLPFEQGLAATADTNSFVVKEIPKPRALPDEDLGNHEVEAVVMVGKVTEEGEMEEDQLNSGPLEKGKRKEKIPQEERGSKKTNGVRIGISLEDILQNEGMSLKDAANNLNVSRSTLKRSCREYGINRWPPRKKHKIISQSCPNESPAFVDQEQITQLNSDALPTSNQVLANADTTSVTVKARYGNDTIIKFRLSRPWGMVELEQQVKKRLAGTFDIKYKDEDNEWILIACDEDLQDCISSFRPQGPTSIEVLLVPK